MSEYVKTCKYCKQEIKMSDDSGKWNPYNKDGSAHDCRSKQETSTYEKKVATIDGLVALDLIPHLGKALRFIENEVRGTKVVEVYLEK